MATTPNMNLSLPVPTVTIGPDYADQNNTAFAAVDAHDHSAGKGVSITPNSININSDLDYNDNHLIDVKSTRNADQLAELTGPDDLRSTYSVNGELFYNDGVGNNVQITVAGGLNAASIGGIGGDYGTSTALLAYDNLSKTFTFEQNTGIAAHIDASNVVIREDILGANGVTIKSPTTLGAGYQLTLPTGLPASNLPLSVNASGQLSSSLLVTSQIGDNQIISSKIGFGEVKADNIGNFNVTTDKILNENVTYEKLEPLNYGLSTLTGSATGASFVNIGSAVGISTSGRPVHISLIANSGGTVSGFSVSSGSGHQSDGIFTRDGAAVSSPFLLSNSSLPKSGGPLSAIDHPVAGSYSYRFQMRSGIGTASITNMRMLVYEL